MMFKPIGRIHSVYKEKKEAPKQGKFKEVVSEIEIFSDYVAALRGVEGLTHLLVLYWGDQANREVTETIPPWTSEKFGVFSTRSPNRPNPIAFCVVEVVEVQENKLRVKHLDALDQSPLLDIKAYDPEIDCYPEARRIRKNY